jgi:serine/threonine-protein kinase
MEFVRGRTLEQVLADGGRLPVRRALLIARQIADGLAAAHKLGMVHRDIKPDNIVLGTNDQVKIMDFGLLRKADDIAVITAKGEFVGTVRYASPEHMRGERVDARGDLYSLGVVLYEMLAGSRPHDGGDTMRLAREVAYGAAPRVLHEVAADVPQDISALVHLLIQLKPENRPPSAESVVKSIDALLR